MLAEIQWIFFDVGSTLVDESLAYRQRIQEAIAGTDITEPEFVDTMLDFYRQNKKGDLEAIRKYGLTKPPWHSEKERLYPETKACLQKLREKYQIGIIANQPRGTGERLRAFGIGREIDLIAASAEEGAAKPDRRLFEIALERAGCLPRQAVMVGDRLDNDIAPAKALGMKTIWVKQGFGQYSTPRNEWEKPDFEVNGIQEAAELLLMESGAWLPFSKSSP